MKQTNNAIKFLMAQYRAIFNNAYFKGLATAALVTVAMAAGQAQAASGLTGALNANKAQAVEIEVTSGNQTLDASDGSTKYSLGITVTGGKATTSGSLFAKGDLTVNNAELIVSGGGILLGHDNDQSQTPYVGRFESNSGTLTLSGGNIGVVDFALQNGNITLTSGGAGSTNLTAYGEGGIQASPKPIYSGNANSSLTNMTAELQDATNITSIGVLTVDSGTYSLKGNVNALNKNSDNLTYLSGAKELKIQNGAVVNVSGATNALHGKSISIKDSTVKLSSGDLTIGSSYDLYKRASGDSTPAPTNSGSISLNNVTLEIASGKNLNFGYGDDTATTLNITGGTITNSGSVNFYTPKISMSAANLNALVDNGKVEFKSDAVANVAGDLDLTKKVLSGDGTLNSTNFALENGKTLKLASDGTVTLGKAFAVNNFTVEAGVLKLTPDTSNSANTFTQTSGSLVALNGLTSANETTLKEVIVSGSASAKSTLTLGQAGTTNGSVTKVDKLTVKGQAAGSEGTLNIYGKWDLTGTELNVGASGAANLANAANVTIKNLTVDTNGALNITDGSLLTVDGTVSTKDNNVSLTDNSKLSVKYAEANKSSALAKVKLDGSSTLVLTGYEPTGGSIDLAQFGTIKTKFIGDTGLLELSGVKINSGVAQNADVTYTQAQSGKGAAGVFDTNTVTGVTGDVAGSNDWGTVELANGQTELSIAANGAVTLNGNGSNKLVADSTGATDAGVKLASGSILTVEATGTIKEVTAAADGNGKFIVDGKNTVNVTNDLGSKGAKLDKVNVITGSTLNVKNVYAKTLDLGGNLVVTNKVTLSGDSSITGSLKADSLTLTSGKTLAVGQDGTDSKSGLLDVGTLDLAGGSLIIDPAYTSKASEGYVEGTTSSPSLTDLEINVSGNVGVGQNAIFVAGMRNDDAAAQEIIARYTNAIGSLDKNGNDQIDAGEFGALFIANGQYTVASNTATIVDHTKQTADFSSAFTANQNQFVLGNDSALFVTDEFAQDLLNDASNAVINFAGNTGVLALSNDSKIYIDTALTATDTIDLVSGTGATVTGATANTIEAANGLLQGTIGSDGKVQFRLVEANARAKLFNQSNPVQDLTISALKGDLNKAETGVEYLLLAAKDNGGQASEATSRLAVYGGAIQATNLAQQAATDAVADRMSRANPNGSLVFANNAQGGGLWLSPVYKSHESDSFDADGVDYGVDADITGLVLGADSTTESGVRVGGYFNFGSGSIDGQGVGSQVSNDADYFGLGLYAGMTLGQMSFVADAGFTQVSNDIEQTTGLTKFDKVTADTDATAITLGLRGEYKLNVATMDVTPHLGVRYTRLAVDGYDAKADGYTVATTDVDTMQMFAIPFGVTISKDIAVGAWTVKPVFDLTLTANAGDTDAKLDTNFGSNALNLTSEAFDSFTYGATMGIDAKYGENFSVGLNTNYVGSSNTDEFGVMGNVRYMF